MMSKKLLICTLLLTLLNSFAFAQVWSRGYHGENEKSEYLSKSKYGIDAVFSIELPSHFTGIIRYAPNGQVKFKREIRTTAKRPAVNALGSLLLIGIETSCDAPPPTTHKFMYLLDSLGQTIKTYSFISTYYYDFIPLTACPDSGFIAVADTLLLKFDKGLNLQKKQSLNLKKVSFVGYTAHGLMISGKIGNQSVLQRLDTGYQVISTSPAPTTFQYYERINVNTSMFCSIYGKGYKFYHDTLSGDSLYGKIPHVFGDSIVSVTKNKIFISDTSGNLVKTYTAPDTSTIYTEALAYKDTLLHTSYQMAYVQYMKGIYGYKCYQTNVTKAHRGQMWPGNKDMAITSINVLQNQTTSTAIGKSTVSNIEIVVKNNTSSPISRFSLNTFSKFELFCIDVFEQRTYTPTIQPGGSYTVSEQWTTLLSDAYVAITANTYKKCFFLSLPDGETDINRGDNESCQMINIVGLRENATNNQLSIYPIPAHNQLQLTSETLIESLVVTDITGKVVMTATPQSESSLLDSSSLPNGIYFVLCKTANGTSTNKIIIQH